MQSAPMKKVLIVEDQPHIARILNDVLKKSGYETEIANNGAIGVDKARAFMPDLIFMDIMMPIKTGFEATREIRASDGLENVAIIFLTAKGQQADKDNAMELGANGFITKPFSPRAILSIVEETIGKA